MRRTLSISCLLLTLALASADVRAQSDVTLTVTILRPHARLSDWQSDPSSIQVIMQNTTSQVLTVRLSGHIDNPSSGVTVTTKDDDMSVPPIVLPPNGTVTLTGNSPELSLLNPNAVTISGTDVSTIQRTGLLPEGTYTMCLQAVDYTSPHTARSVTMCPSFTLMYVDPPTLIQPSPCGDTVTPTTPQALIFMWTQTSPPITSGSTDYNFVMCEVPSGRNPNDAFQSRTSPDFFARTFHSQTSFTYSPTEPALRRGHTYAWRVQAVDPNGSTGIRNDGASEVCSFTYGSSDTSGTGTGGSTSTGTCSSPSITIAYPPNGERVPYRYTPVIVRFQPYCDSFHRFQSSFTPSGGTMEPRDLPWPSGPLAAESAALGETITQDQAEYIWIGRHNGQPYTPGQTQNWTGTVTLSLISTPLTPSSLTGNFSTGMGASQLSLPANDAVVDTGDVHLQWNTANAPSDNAIKPPYNIRQAENGTQTSYNLAIHEKWVLEVSRSHDMSSPVYTTNGSINKTDIAESDISSIKSEVYKQLDDHHSFSDTGDYYWRVRWLTDTSGTASDANSYQSSDVHHFIIRRGGAGGGSTVSTDSCIIITPLVPILASVVGPNPHFSIHIRDSINTSAITGGTLKIWRRHSVSEDTLVTMARTPDSTRTFTGSDASNFAPRSLQSGSFDLRFVNDSSAGQPHTFTGAQGQSYLWNFTLQFNGSTIRRDHNTCTRTQVTSYSGIFAVDTGAGHHGPADCHDDCSAPTITDHNPTTRSFHDGDSVMLGRFMLHLTSGTTGTGSNLSGSGSIAIQFLRGVSVAVDFSNLHVNDSNQVYDGTARVHWGGTSPLPPLSGAGSALGLTQDEINGVSQASSQPARLLSSLIGGTPITLPFGIDTTVGGQRIVVGVIGMEFTPQKAKLAAAISIPLPFLGPGIGVGLGAKDICMAPGGLGGDGYGKLYLPADLGYRQDDPDTWGLVLKGCSEDSATHAIHDDGTFVSWTCHGFESLRITAAVTFPRTWLLPVLSTGGIDSVSSHKVTATFSVLVERTVLAAGGTNWGWMASATMGKFAPAGAPEFVMEVSDMVIDESDDQNPTGITFPTGYTGDHGNTWRGFYLHRLSCALPSQLRTFDSSRPLQIALQNFLIDNSGLSASFRVENVVMYPQGNFGEWGASIDTIGVDFASSSLQRGYIVGRIQIPISDSALDYRAVLGRLPSGHGLEFDFSIRPRDTINANLWVAKLSLNPTSSIVLTARSDSGFSATATLSGSVTIAGNVNNPHGGGGMPGMNFRGITFTNFVVTTNDPHVSVGTWAFASDQHSAGGFPLSISDIGIVSGDRGGDPGVGLQFHVQLNLQSGSTGIGGGTTLTLWGALGHSSTGGQQFRFDGISVDAITLSVDAGSAVHITGTITFYNGDPTFGNGFKGAVHATFLQKVTIDGSVQFGAVPYNSGHDTNRYWYVDAMAYLPAGIPFMTGLGFYGFGGGAWYHMQRTGEMPHPPTSAPPTGVQANTYVPDATIGLGLRAKVCIGTMPSDNAFNADIALEVQFLTSGGIGSIALLGDGYVMAGIHDRTTAPASVHVGIHYCFPTTTLDGRMSIAIGSPYNSFINILNHDSIIVFHVDPTVWYFRMGSPPPDQRIGVQIGLGGAGVRFDSYLCMGDNIPTATLPDEITSRLTDLHIVRNDAMSQGDGFAFGASLNINTGRQYFLIFYGELQLLVGFDIALLHLGADATCEGGDGAFHPGMDGWYASGDLYAYFHAGIGLHVDVWFTSGDFEILSVSAAAALAGGAPNPSWLAGAVEGEYSILDGLVSGHCHFGFQVGDQCIPVAAPRESPLATIGLIADVTPHNGERNVDVFNHPQAAFNFAVERSFDISELDAEGNTQVRTFRIRVNDFSLHLASNRSSVAGTRSIATDGLTATFTPNDILASRTNYYVNVYATSQEFVNGSWGPAHRLDGSPIDQTVTNSFMSGTEPDHIPPENIAYTYPMDRQRYFLQNECRTGVIVLKQGQPDLFTTSSSRVTGTASIIGRFIPTTGGDTGTVTPTYNNGSRTVSFDISTLQNSTIYAFQLVRHTTPGMVAMSGMSGMGGLSGGGGGGGTGGVSGISSGGMRMISTTFTRRMAGGATVNILQRRLPGTEVGEGEKLLYVYFFKTSQYNSLAEKVGAWSPMATTILPPFGNLEGQTAKFSGPELLDQYDMNGLTYDRAGTTYRIAPLIRPTANTRTTSWHTSFTNPWVYDAWTRLQSLRLLSGTPVFTREVTNYNRGLTSGVLAEYQGRANGLISDDEILPSALTSLTRGIRFRSAFLTSGFSGLGFHVDPPHVEINYNHGSVVPFDFGSVQSCAARALSLFGSEFFNPTDYAWLQSLAAKHYERMYPGTYPIQFIYGYPGCVEPDSFRRGIVHQDFEIPSLAPIRTFHR